MTVPPRALGGMTGASGGARVQKALPRPDGVVTASVNLATESATVDPDPAVVAPAGLAEAVREHVGRRWPFVEVQAYPGGQPHYPLLVGVE